MGFGPEKPGAATVLLRLCHNSAAKFERSTRARCQPERESIPIPIPTPTPIQTMIGQIGNHCLEATPEGARHFGRALAPAPSAIGTLGDAEDAGAEWMIHPGGGG